MQKYYIPLVLFVLVLFMAGCRGRQQSKLIGTWKLIPHENPETQPTQIWDFYDGDKLEVTTTYLNGSDTTIVYAYVIDGTKFSIYNPASDPERPYYESQLDIRGDYWVDELEKANFKVTKRTNPLGVTGGSVYLRVELVKQ